MSVDVEIIGRKITFEDRGVWLADDPEGDGSLLMFVNGDRRERLRLSAPAVEALRALLTDGSVGERHAETVRRPQLMATWRIVLPNTTP